MKPWERRLKDLAQLLTSCASTYFNPDLFRMNTNQFLQTARTITFIIQKNKVSIPDYDNWYRQNVIDAWDSDEVMQWAKESRNIIEKEGDLDLNSTLHVTLLFSYLQEEDIAIQCGRAELLNASIKKLIRLAQKSLPTGIADAAAVKIERRWVTASLPEWELLHALSYIYGRMFGCCQELARNMNGHLDKKIPDVTIFDEIREHARQVRYVKLRGQSLHTLKTEHFPLGSDFTPPEYLRTTLEAMRPVSRSPSSLHETVQFFSRLAKAIFEHHGHHVPMLFLFDENWNIIDMLSTHFADQTDKFIFWRTVADRIANLKACGLVWISELWLREMRGKEVPAIRNIPIVGERLHVVGLDKLGQIEEIAWNIQRTRTDSTPTLEFVSEPNTVSSEAMPYYLVPVMRAMGISVPSFVDAK